MSSIDVHALTARVARLSDGELIAALATPGDYTPEAMMVYETEAKRRRISADTVRPAAQTAAQAKLDQQAVTWSIKGIGEKLYGQRAFRTDGSYQTTRWFVFLHLPIYPLTSLRVRRGADGKPSVLEVLPIQWRQALETYGFVLLSWAWIALGYRVLERLPSPATDLGIVPLFAVPILSLYFMRYRARTKARLK